MISLSLSEMDEAVIEGQWALLVVAVSATASTAVLMAEAADRGGGAFTFEWYARFISLMSPAIAVLTPNNR